MGNTKRIRVISAFDIPSAQAAALPLERETRQMFFQLGTTALNNLLGPESFALFSALESAEPDQPYAKVGLGMAYMCCSEFGEAARFLQDPIVQQSPMAASANALLAICCKLDGNASGFEHASAQAVAGDAGMASTIELLKETQYAAH